MLSPAKPGGRHEAHPRREVVNAILYLLRTGRSWRQLPKDFPPWETVYWHFVRWCDDGSVDALHDVLRERVREAEGRDAKPTAAIINAQSVKGADTVPRATRGYDAGKKTNGRKRHIVVDTIGLLVIVLVTAANVQDRDGARPALRAVRKAFPTISLVWADGGYAGKLLVGQDGGTDRAGDRAQARGAAHLRGAAQALGGRAHVVVDHEVPAAGSRLRATAQDLGRDGQVGDGRPDDTTPRPTPGRQPWSTP
jgi:transposase